MQSPPPIPRPAASTSTDVLIWVGVLIVAVLLMGALILVVRKRMLAKDMHSSDNWISDLRQMHKRGELSTEEYEAARRALSARFASSTRTGSVSSPARPTGQSVVATELRAKPGFDLTGAPLPPSRSQPPPGPGPYDRKPPP